MEIQVISNSKSRKALIEATLAFYAKELNLSKSRYTLIVETVKDFSKETGFRAAVVKIQDRVLSLAIDSRLDLETFYNTLAHEMIHVKQYAKGQLDVVTKRNGRVDFKWLGRINKAEYLDAPWEQEAFSKERLLANKLYKIIAN